MMHSPWNRVLAHFPGAPSLLQLAADSRFLSFRHQPFDFLLLAQPRLRHNLAVHRYSSGQGNTHDQTF